MRKYDINSIREESKNHKGLEFTNDDFSTAFRVDSYIAKTTINLLVSDGTFSIAGKNKRGLNIYKIN